MSIMPIHFGRTGVVSARDSMIVSGDGPRFDFTIRRQNGQIVGRFRRPATAHPVTPAELDALIASQLRDLPVGSRGDMERRLRETPNRSTMPFYDGVVISDAGESWIRHFVTSVAEDRIATWSVFSARGEWLCDVPMPAALFHIRLRAIIYSARGSTRVGTCLSKSAGFRPAAKLLRVACETESSWSVQQLDRLSAIGAAQTYRG